MVFLVSLPKLVSLTISHSNHRVSMYIVREKSVVVNSFSFRNWSYRKVLAVLYAVVHQKARSFHSQQHRQKIRNAIYQSDLLAPARAPTLVIYSTVMKKGVSRSFWNPETSSITSLLESITVYQNVLHYEILAYRFMHQNSKELVRESSSPFLFRTSPMLPTEIQLHTTWSKVGYFRKVEK